MRMTFEWHMHSPPTLCICHAYASTIQIKADMPHNFLALVLCPTYVQTLLWPEILDLLVLSSTLDQPDKIVLELIVLYANVLARS
jgi:hypothetical protein